MRQIGNDCLSRRRWSLYRCLCSTCQLSKRCLNPYLLLQLHADLASKMTEIRHGFKIVFLEYLEGWFLDTFLSTCVIRTRHALQILKVIMKLRVFPCGSELMTNKKQ